MWNIGARLLTQVAWNNDFPKNIYQNAKETFKAQFISPDLNSKNFKLHLNDKYLHLQRPTFESPLSPRSGFEEFKIEERFALQCNEVNFNEEQVQSCLSTKETNQSEPSIELQSIDWLQFESNSPIEDKISQKRLTSIPAQCLSIFDGHGGNTLAEYASKKIAQLIDSYISSHLTTNDPQNDDQKIVQLIKSAVTWAYDQIQESFEEILQQLYKKGNKEIIKIGTCALTTVIWKNRIVSANCGDSQAIVVFEDQDGLCFFVANEQLNTSNPNELQRIQKEFKGVDDSVLVKSKTTQKVYVKGILQPTRTLGDYYLKKEKYFQKIQKSAKTPFRGPYIKHAPVFNVIPIKSNFRYLILASDGLWDFATKKDILKVVQSFHSLVEEMAEPLSIEQLNRAYIEKVPVQPSKKLTEFLRDHVLQKCAKRKNKNLQELMQIPPGDRRNFCDDISIVTVSFKEDVFE